MFPLSGQTKRVSATATQQKDPQQQAQLVLVVVIVAVWNVHDVSLWCWAPQAQSIGHELRNRVSLQTVITVFSFSFSIFFLFVLILLLLAQTRHQTDNEFPFSQLNQLQADWWLRRIQDTTEKYNFTTAQGLHQQELNRKRKRKHQLEELSGKQANRDVRMAKAQTYCFAATKANQSIN